MKLFGLYDIYTISTMNRMLKSIGYVLKLKTRKEDDQIEIILEKL